jgi:hypothetical protein
VSADRLLARIAERQHGLVTYRQALDAGLTARQIHRRLLTGRLVQVRVGVYAIAGTPPTQEQAWLAAVLAAGDGAVLGHASAAHLWQLRERPEPGGIHIVTPGPNRVRLDGVVHHRSGLLVPLDVTVRRQVPTLTAARTLLEIAGRLGVTATGRTLDDGMRRTLFTLEEVRACHARLAGPGRRRLRDARLALGQRLPGYDPGGSDVEVRAISALVGAGFPMPVQQHRVVIEGRTRFIDLAYPQRMLAIELGGWTYHRWRSAYVGDRARTRQLQRAAWTVVEFTADDSPDELVRTVRALWGPLAA